MTTPHDKALIAAVDEAMRLLEGIAVDSQTGRCKFSDVWSAIGAAREILLHAPIPEAGNGDGWNHDMDAAPKDGTAVLVCLDAKGKDPIVCEAYFYSFDEDDKGWFLANQHPKDYTAEQIYPDAWRPLPPPPSIRSSDTGRGE